MQLKFWMLAFHAVRFNLELNRHLTFSSSDSCSSWSAIFSSGTTSLSEPSDVTGWVGPHVGPVLIDAPSKFAVLTVKEEAPSHCLVHWLIPKKVSTQCELIHYQFENVWWNALYITFKLYGICNFWLLIQIIYIMFLGINSILKDLMLESEYIWGSFQQSDHQGLHPDPQRTRPQ